MIGLSTLDEARTAAVRAACTDVVMRYAISVDHEAWDDLFGLLSDECVWTRPGGRPMVGPAEARAFFEQTQAQRRATNPHGTLQRHLVTSLCIDVVDERTAEATWYALLFQDHRYDGRLPRPMTEPALVAEYRTSFRREDGGWRISRHDATHVFRAGA